MSHFTVTVVLPPEAGENADTLRAHLDRVLERYNENREVEPYTDDDGGKTTYNPDSKWDWWVIGGRWRGAYLPKPGADYARLLSGESGAFDNKAKQFFDEDGTPRNRADGGPVGMLDFEAMRQEKRKEAELDWDQYQTVTHGTEEPLPWSHFVDRVEGARMAMPKSRVQAIYDAENVVNERFGVPLAIPYDDIPADRKYGPDGTGDGPYWTEREAAFEALKAQPLLDGDGGTEPPPEDDDYDPLAALRRDEDKQWAGTRYGAYKAQVKAAEKKAAKQWDREVVYSIDQAREDYGSQERIKKIRSSSEYRNWFEGPESIFEGISREDYTQQQADRAVPGYATISIDGEWLAPGRMGWFGMSSDDDNSYEIYARKVNEMLDKLEPETFLVQLDCHI